MMKSDEKKSAFPEAFWSASFFSIRFRASNALLFTRMNGKILPETLKNRQISVVLGHVRALFPGGFCPDYGNLMGIFTHSPFSEKNSAHK